jgi:hypothetical protein
MLSWILRFDSAGPAIAAVDYFIMSCGFQFW